MNYTELVEALQDYPANDDTQFVDNINNFIRAAEEEVFLALRGPLAWKTNSAGTLAASSPTETLPNGTIDVVDMYVIGPDASTDGRPLLRKDHSFLTAYAPLRTGADTTGMPRFYCVETAGVDTGEPTKQIRVTPIPDQEYTYRISYYGKATTDSITTGATPAAPTTTNTWLSAAFPSVLLYGALKHAAIFMKEEADVLGMYAEQFNQGLTMLKNMTESRQAGDEFSDLGKKDSAL